MKYDVFISKNSADQEFTDSVVQFLESAGLKVFESKKDLPFLKDADYSKAIFNALENSENIIVICSPNENGSNSRWVYDEWSWFINEIRSNRRNGQIMTIRKGIAISKLNAQLRKYESFEHDAYQSRILPYFGKEIIVIQPGPTWKSKAPEPSVNPIQKPDKDDYLNLLFQNGEAKAQADLLCPSFIDDIIHLKHLRVCKVEPQIRELAEQGVAEAEYAMGFLESYPYGPNIRVSGDEHYNNAIHWLERAAGKGHVKAQQQLASVYYWGGEKQKAIPFAKTAADEGDLDAAIILAWAHKDLKNDREYADALRLAATIQKNTRSNNIHCPALDYGILLYEGRVVPQDLSKSIAWLDVAIKQSYDNYKEDDALYYKAKALFAQGHKLRALWALDSTHEERANIQELRKTIRASINPFKK